MAFPHYNNMLLSNFEIIKIVKEDVLQMTKRNVQEFKG